MTWSLVSCNEPSWRPGLCRRPDGPSVARIEATTGRHTLQPRPVPKAATTSLKVPRPASWTSSNRSARGTSKCSHRARETVMPVFSSSWFRILVSVGTHEPHTVPALVHSLIAPTV